MLILGTQVDFLRGVFPGTLFPNHLCIFVVFAVTSFKTVIFLKSELLGHRDMFGASQVAWW